MPKRPINIKLQPLFNKDNKTLMVQGTTSDAGKSVLVAGLCRVIARAKKLNKNDNNVAPFKPQNMALNSAVTSDGGEIGRAQAVQAQACYLPPHTDMNPVLLKPSSDTGAQVIIQGHAINAMQASEFHDYKKTAMNAVLESHHRLYQQYNRIIVEGAGSPAEINLRNNDIANMGFAEAVDCPVIIVADIDRGGVFAHLVGTLDLLAETEQNRVAGFVINRFRGDIKLLEPGLRWLEERTQKPVLAVIPYLTDFYLDAEDAITAQQTTDASQAKLNVLVPVLPRISNHTDFDALRAHPNVNLQFISINHSINQAFYDDFPAADLIILPGSKNVRKDLASLKQAGWQKILQRHCRYGGKVLGICGGYQMLGKEIDDPEGVEDLVGKISGFSMLNHSTRLTGEKKLSQVTANFVHSHFFEHSTKSAASASGSKNESGNDSYNSESKAIKGYEIHCGVSQIEQQHALLQIQDNDGNKYYDGQVNPDNNIMGTYLHGLFDQPEACNRILKWAGLTSSNAVDLDQIREQQLNRLADCLEQHFEPDFLQQLICVETKYCG